MTSNKGLEVQWICMQGLGTVNHRNRVEKKVVNRLEKSLSMTNPSHQQHTDITKMINTAQTVSFQCHGMLFLLKTQSIDPTYTRPTYKQTVLCTGSYFISTTTNTTPSNKQPVKADLKMQSLHAENQLQFHFLLTHWKKKKKKKIPIAWEQHKQLEGLGCEQVLVNHRDRDSVVSKSLRLHWKFKTLAKFLRRTNPNTKKYWI